MTTATLEAQIAEARRNVDGWRPSAELRAEFHSRLDRIARGEWKGSAASLWLRHLLESKPPRRTPPARPKAAAKAAARPATVARPRPATWRSRLTGCIPAGARHKSGSRLAIGAFAEAIGGGREVQLRWEHESEPIASTADGSLQISDDGLGGLAISATPYKTEAGRLAIRAALSREYGLSPGYTSESLSGDQIVAIEGLLEISLVRSPLFGSTCVECVYAD